MKIPELINCDRLMARYPGISKPSAQSLLRKIGGWKAGGQRFITFGMLLQWEAQQQGRTDSLLDTGSPFTDAINARARELIEAAHASGWIEIKRNAA